jgi:hypothetical protein
MTLLQVQQGATVRCSCTLTDDAGAPLDADVLTLTIAAPDGTQSTPAVVDDGGATYHGDVAIPLARASAGTWRWRWTASGDVDGTAEGEWLVHPRRVE